jgi:hypothetical protein
MVVQCPVGILASGIVIEAPVCGGDSVGIVKAVLWQVQCNVARSRSNGENIIVAWHPVRHLGIVHRDRSCMSEQWATIQRGGVATWAGLFRYLSVTTLLDHSMFRRQA